MLYSRHDIVELVNQEAPELRHLLISLIWHLSRGDPTEITGMKPNERFGLLQIPILHARQIGFTANESELLNPPTNVAIGAQLITKLGLVEFLGREFIAQYWSISALERFLDENSVQSPDVAYNAAWRSQRPS